MAGRNPRTMIKWGWALPLLLVPAQVQAQNVRVTDLADVAFGTIANFNSDLTNSQSICAYSSATNRRYSVTARGSGAGGAFTLASGSRTLAYEVQWSSSADQTSGTPLSPNVALTGQTSSAVFLSNCFFNYTATASLITILRASAVSSATAGSYSGTLTVMLAPN